MANTVVWADIPVTDMDRARAFYGAVLQTEIELMEGSGGTVALLPGEDDDVSADLALGEEMRPSTDGCTIYLDAAGDSEGMMKRAVAAGGEILMPVTDMGEMIGFIGAFKDSEGNRIGVHSPPKG
jgi:hypothetical protein